MGTTRKRRRRSAGRHRKSGAVYVLDYGGGEPIRFASSRARPPKPLRRHAESVKLVRVAATLAEARRIFEDGNRRDFARAILCLQLAKHRVLQGGVFTSAEQVDRFLAWRRGERASFTLR